jgi:hypothetical protein
MTKNLIAWALLAIFIDLERPVLNAQAPAVATTSPPASARGDAHCGRLQNDPTIGVSQHV